jgi:hypothetical protein
MATGARSCTELKSLLEWLREIVFVSPVNEWTNAAQVKARCGYKASHPQLDQRRMLGIDAKIRIVHVRDASGNVIGLINSGAIRPGCYGATDGRSGQQQEQDKDEDTQTDSRRFQMLDLRWRDRSPQRFSGLLNKRHERVERRDIIVPQCLQVENKWNNGRSLQRPRRQPVTGRTARLPFVIARRSFAPAKSTRE